jgi:hypothetical protein
MPEDTIKVASGAPFQIINGHVLDKDCVLEMTEKDIATQRNGGIILVAVDDKDKREVFDHTKPPPQQQDKDEGKPGKNDGHEDGKDGKRGGIPPGQKPSERDAHAGGSGPVTFNG